MWVQETRLKVSICPSAQPLGGPAGEGCLGAGGVVGANLGLTHGSCLHPLPLLDFSSTGQGPPRLGITASLETQPRGLQALPQPPAASTALCRLPIGLLPAQAWAVPFSLPSLTPPNPSLDSGSPKGQTRGG